MGIPSMGCQNPFHSVRIDWRFCADLFLDESPGSGVRRDANILNKHTILWIVLNLLTT